MGQAHLWLVLKKPMTKMHSVGSVNIKASQYTHYN